MPLKDLRSKDAPAPTKSPAKPTRRILFVDDDSAIRRLCCEVLTESGYHVDTAADGEAGWDKLCAVRHDPDNYHLLITDNNMPKLTGVQLIKKVRFAGMFLPIILASGTAPTNDEWLHLAESLQLTAILPKPFSPCQLVQTVEDVLHSPTSQALQL
jgi:DNA-binding response OmpR family regulator